MVSGTTFSVDTLGADAGAVTAEGSGEANGRGAGSPDTPATEDSAAGTP
jgi:hypothetical protein